MKKNFNIAAMVLLLLLVTGGALYWHFTSTPEYSLWQAQSALEKHDVQQFQQFVDVDQLSASTVDQFFEQQDQGPGMALMMGLLSLAKPQFASVVKHELLGYVARGQAGTDSSRNTSSAPFSLGKALEGHQEAQRPDFQDVAYTKKDGSTAIVGIKINYPGYDTALVLDVKMQQAGRHWKVTEISNLKSYMEALSELKKRRKP